MRTRGSRGTITLWLLGLCLMLFALGGISLDLWRMLVGWFFEHRCASFRYSTHCCHFVRLRICAA